MKHNGRFIIVDGIAGSGKSTILRAIETWTETCHHSVFRLSQWTDVIPPRFDENSNYDVYFTYEPTRTWIGRAIRYELSREDEPYGCEELAHAFALDRQIMYHRLIIPALKAGKTIIQDRGVSTSFVYQPIMTGNIPLETVKNLPGNKLAMSYAPDALILTKLPAEYAMQRIQNRNDDNKGVFADLEFLKKLETRFGEPWLRELFKTQGTTVHELDMNGTLEETTKRAQNLIDHILSTC